MAHDKVLKKILILPAPISPIPTPAPGRPPTVAAEPIGNQRAVILPPDARATDQRDIVKAMFTKYNVDYDECPWLIRPPRQGARVEKRIRMRVRFVCHHCQTNFSTSGECINCHHRRCEQCTRVPPKKEAKGKEDGSQGVTEERLDVPIVSLAAERMLVGDAAADTGVLSTDNVEDEDDLTRLPSNIVPKRPTRRREAPLGMPSRIGGRHLVRKPLLQRVHRTCCKCHRSFVRDSKHCPQCSHVRCTQCPRMPPKLRKWPQGYPGDIIPANAGNMPRERNEPELRVECTCHECGKQFIEGQGRCSECSHERCSDCVGDPFKPPMKHSSEKAAIHDQSGLEEGIELAKDAEIAEQSGEGNMKTAKLPGS